MTERARLLAWTPFAVVAAIGVVLAVMHAPTGAEVFWDKALHAGAYLVAGALALRAAHGRVGPLRARPSVVAGVLTIGHGAFVETLQAFVPWRDGSLGDLAADVVGFGLALAIFRAWRRRSH